MSIQGNKRVMLDYVAAKEFARAFAGYYGYTVNNEVKIINGTLDKQASYTIVTPDAGELEEFINLVREGEVRRTW